MVIMLDRVHRPKDRHEMLRSLIPIRGYTAPGMYVRLVVIDNVLLFLSGCGDVRLVVIDNVLLFPSGRGDVEESDSAQGFREKLREIIHQQQQLM